MNELPNQPELPPTQPPAAHPAPPAPAPESYRPRASERRAGPGLAELVDALIAEDEAKRLAALGE